MTYDAVGTPTGRIHMYPTRAILLFILFDMNNSVLWELVPTGHDRLKVVRVPKRHATEADKGRRCKAPRIL
jgi:hypothetical protein